MMTRIRNLVMLLFTFILFSCNGDDNNNSVDSSSVLIKKIQTTWIERYMYLSSEPGTGNPLPVYADADIIAEYTYEEHKLEKIDYKASFSNYSNGISSSSSSMFWQFTYTDDLITKVETYYNDDAPHLQYTFEFEYDEQKRLINFTEEGSYEGPTSYSVSYSNNTVLVSDLPYAGQETLFTYSGNNLQSYEEDWAYMVYEYDNKNSPFKNITGFSNASLGFLIMHNRLTANGQSSSLCTQWSMNSPFNNLKKKNQIYKLDESTVYSLNVIYNSYNNMNYPINVYESSVENPSYSESIIEYYE